MVKRSRMRFAIHTLAARGVEISRLYFFYSSDGMLNIEIGRACGTNGEKTNA
jgi:hypothetical protein